MATPYYSISNYITWAKGSQSLSIRGEKRDLAFKGLSVSSDLDQKLFCARKSLEWEYAQNPNSSYLYELADYVYALSFPYVLEAMQITVDGGLVIIPTTPTSGTPVSMPFYFAKKADFGSATDYTNTALVGKDIAVFLQSANRYLNEAEYVLLVGGVVRILVDGFDSQTFSTGEYIMRVDINGVAAPSTIVDTFNYVLDSITTITDLPSGADYQTRRVIIRPNGHQYYWSSGFEFNDLHPEQEGAYSANTMQIYDFMYNPVTGKNECVGQTINIAI